MVDPRPETVDGETKIVMTPQLIHDIFDEYPVVAKAYNENVPSKVRAAASKIPVALKSCSCPKQSFGRDILSQNCTTRNERRFGQLRFSTSFWTTQYWTNIWKKLTTVQLSAHSLSSKLISSLELEPRRQRTDRVDLFVDLGATLEDHGEVRVDQCTPVSVFHVL